MKRINNKSIIETYRAVVLLCMLCLAGCGQEEKRGLELIDNIAPAPPVVVSVENIGGGAIIIFTAPKDDDLLYVVATYMINGVERTTKASPYVNKLRIEGFGTEDEYQISLKSVDKSKNESQSVPVTIKPLTPPVKSIYSSLKVIDSFGGVKITWTNPMEASIIIEVFKKDDNEWISVENFYSSVQDGWGTIRGYKPEPVTFRIRIRDRWDNYSDFLETNNLPLYEEKLDKSKFKEVRALPGDIRTTYSGLPISRIWDGLKNVGSSCFHGSQSADDPCMNHSITFDMGQTARISRFITWQRTENASFIFSHNNLKQYIIYGCNELTDEMYAGGRFDEEKNTIYPTFEGWTEVLNTRCYRPSEHGGTTADDNAWAINNGDEHEVPIEIPPFRYVRILFLENWSGGVIAQIGEMDFFGQVVN